MTGKQETEVRFLFRMYILYFCLRNVYACVSNSVYSSLFAFLALSVREQMLSPSWSCLGPRVDEIPAIALLTCVLAPGKVLVLLLVPLMALPSVCSLQRDSIVHWSCSALPDGFPYDSCLTCTIFSSIWIEILSCGNPGILQKCCLRAAEVLNFVVSFQQCLLAHQSSIIMFQFHILPPGILFPLLQCSLICPRLLSLGYLSHLDLPISLLPLGSQVRAEVPGTALLCWHSLGCLCASEELGRVWCSWLRAKVWILRAFGFSMLKNPSCCLLWPGICSMHWCVCRGAGPVHQCLWAAAWSGHGGK